MRGTHRRNELGHAAAAAGKMHSLPVLSPRVQQGFGRNSVAACVRDSPSSERRIDVDVAAAVVLVGTERIVHRPHCCNSCAADGCC